MTVFHMHYMSTPQGDCTTYKLDALTIKKLLKGGSLEAGARIVIARGGLKIRRARKMRANAVVARWESPLLSLFTSGEHAVEKAKPADEIVGRTEEGSDVIRLGTPPRDLIPPEEGNEQEETHGSDSGNRGRVVPPRR